ncbi:TonB-dependent receptor domain-containing protein [Pseudaestuariivita rosea]|uniref:TonB-dependent receptor domain-containing protein n=1 Tax=Pseudaestuariivita rosea TaxID=2763263 RepID=UPI001ABA70E6|nr:TonB-dependent receptor [Pseudaestuariivita rosea]
MHVYLYRTVGFILAMTTAATAQDQQEDGFLGTIILGESKRDIQTDTAVPITIVDDQEIKDRQAGTIAELIDSVPGVTLVNGATAAGSGINIRGFGANDMFGTDQKILIQIDGATKGSEELYRIGSQLFTDPLLFREIQVIRGSVGSLEFGSGVVGGVLRIETIDAADLTGGEIGFAGNQLFEFTTNGEGITSSTTLAWQPTETLEFLANYTRRTLDVRQDGDGNDINPDAGDIDDPSWLLKSRLTFGQNLDQTLAFSYTETQSDQRDIPYDSFAIADFGNVDRFVENQTATLRYNYNPVGNDLINFDIEYAYSDEEITNDEVAFVPSPFLRNLVNADHQYQTSTLRFKNTAMFQTGTVEHELRSGIEFIRREREDASAAPGGTDNRIAVYAVNDMQLRNWTITPAIRYEDSRIENDTTATDEDFENSGLMGGLSLRYAFDNGIAVFTSAAYTENLPIIDDLGNSDLMEQNEKARTFELGASYDRPGVFAENDDLAIKATLYDIDLWDATSYGSMTAGEEIIEVERQGLELEAAYALETGFYIDLNANISTGDALRANGETLDWQQNPADSLRLTVGRRFDDVLDLSWEAVANRRYDEGAERSPGYAVHNLRATWQPQFMQGAEVRVGLENVFDHFYTPRLATRPAAGRNLKLTLSKSF